MATFFPSFKDARTGRTAPPGESDPRWRTPPFANGKGEALPRRPNVEQGRPSREGKSGREVFPSPADQRGHDHFACIPGHPDSALYLDLVFPTRQAQEQLEAARQVFARIIRDARE
jgi:hypothetical protein